MSELPEYILDRIFDAPRDMVWKAWTDPELLARWYGPGVETIIQEFNLVVGGFWLNEMKWGDKSMLSKAEFTQVEENQLLVWNHSAADENWNVVANPMMPDWPTTLLTTVSFEDVGEKTKVRLVWTPVDASEAEIACFVGSMNNMGRGWESGYAIMDEIFVELQSS